MELFPGEPPAGPWRVERLDTFARSLAGVAPPAETQPASTQPASTQPASTQPASTQPASTQPASARPLIIAVDGRGGGGKTALANRLCQVMADAAVVHSDDVAWAHSRFGWDDLMIDGVLEPLRAGRGVHYQPPAWRRDGRDGHIDVPATARTVLIEGVGVSRRSLAPLIDVAVWVQSDVGEALRRGIARDMAQQGTDEEAALRNWYDWEAEEVPFLLDDRPWERALVIVGTGSAVPHDPDTEVVLGRKGGRA